MAGTRYAFIGLWGVLDGAIATLYQMARLDRQGAECGRAMTPMLSR
jgi:hypothetical protein